VQVIKVTLGCQPYVGNIFDLLFKPLEQPALYFILISFKWFMYRVVAATHIWFAAGVTMYVNIKIQCHNDWGLKQEITVPFCNVQVWSLLVCQYPWPVGNITLR
jgi:hypothetical protein